MLLREAYYEYVDWTELPRDCVLVIAVLEHRIILPEHQLFWFDSRLRKVTSLLENSVLNIRASSSSAHERTRKTVTVYTEHKTSRHFVGFQKQVAYWRNRWMKAVCILRLLQCILILCLYTYHHWYVILYQGFILVICHTLNPPWMDRTLTTDRFSYSSLTNII